MSFFRDCWESVRGNVRDCMTTPLSRKKLLIFGGVFLAVVLLVIILVFSLRGGGDTSSSKGSDVLRDGPLFGNIGGSLWLKSKFGNSITENATQIAEELQSLQIIRSPLGAVVWSVGASNCSAASQKDAVSQTLEGLDAAFRLSSAVNELEVETSKDGLLDARSNSKVGMIISLNGGYTFDSRLAVLRMYYTLGARILTLTGGCSTPWAGNSGSSSGLTEFGKNVVAEANRLGIVLDLSGSSAAVINTVMGMASNSAPILFNGVGAKHLTDNPINIGNDTIEALVGNKLNLVMVSFKCELIKNKDGSCTAADVINHINMISQKSSRSHVGLAVDFGFPGATYPSDLQNVTAVGKLFDQLYTSGWSLDELMGLAYRNFFNVITSAAHAAVGEKPIDVLEPEAELLSGKPENMTCYSDLPLRYPKVPPAPPAPTSPTEPPTNATMSPTAAPKQ